MKQGYHYSSIRRDEVDNEIIMSWVERQLDE